jgi:hypothetical protein
MIQTLFDTLFQIRQFLHLYQKHFFSMEPLQISTA